MKGWIIVPLIKVYDGFVNNPGDISWDPIKACGDFVLYQRTSREQFLERINDVQIAVTNKQIWDEEAFSKAPHLEMIALTSTGFNVVDLDAATKHKVVVSNVPAYSTPDVAQHTFALMLEMTNHVGDESVKVMAGDWIKSQDFCYWTHPLIELADKTLGVVGMGSIGRAVTKIARAFGMNVIFYNRTPRPELEGDGVREMSLDELWAQSDFITLHVAEAPDTDKIVNAESIAKMKDGVYLINAARGGLVDEAALRDALVSGKVAGAAVDVLRHEPMSPDCPLLDAPHMIITPHIAWATREARTRLFKVIAENIQGFLAGKPQNVVNPAVLAVLKENA